MNYSLIYYKQLFGCFRDFSLQHLSTKMIIKINIWMNEKKIWKFTCVYILFLNYSVLKKNTPVFNIKRKFDIKFKFWYKKLNFQHEMISIHVKYIYCIIYKTALFHTPPGTVILHAPSSVKYLFCWGSHIRQNITTNSGRP